MYKTLAAYAVGVRVNNTEEAIAAALQGGFQGVELYLPEVTALVEERGAEAVCGLFRNAGVRPAGFLIPFDWRAGEADWHKGMEQLPRQAAAAQALGVTRAMTWVLSYSDDLDFEANRRFHIERLRPIAAILNQHGIRFGTEFLGPKTLLDGKRYPFIRTLAEMLALAEEIGPNVGVLLDAWHWYTSGGTVEDILALKPEQVVYVHVNDAPAGIPIDEQEDMRRKMPGATGIIPIAPFLRALKRIGYDGPVAPEPFDADLGTMASDADRLNAVSWAMNHVFDRAGIVPGAEASVVDGVRANIVAERTLRFEWFSLPAAPQGSQVLLRTLRTIISAGTELANYTGLESDTRVPGAWCYYPWRPGYGGIGEVLAVGPHAPRHLQPGMRVYGILNHASHALLDTGWQLCVPVPEELDSSTAVMARVANVAITGIQRARVSLGETVVIVGLGQVGNLAGQFFARAGQRVIGLDLSPARRALAEQVGFAATFDPRDYLPDVVSVSEAERSKRSREIGGGTQPSVIVDAVGDSRIVEQAVHLVADNGQVVMLGTPRAEYRSDCTVALKRAHFRGISIIGALEWKIPLMKRNSTTVSTEGNAELILRMIVDGALQVLPLRTHVLPGGQLATAYDGLLNEKDRYLGVVLDWETYPLPIGED
ncbi:MAG: TIM barrel protein [Capsulimonadales bacterium]|nr:TIM barrel protein [Capsulimonadales bacterium]